MTHPGRIADNSASNPSLVAEFSAAAFDSAIQRPINGLSQLGGEVIGHELPQLHLVDVPKTNTAAEQFAQQAGATVGMLVPFFASRAIVRGAVGGKLGVGYAGVALEGGATGLVMGTALTPVESGQPFWTTRLATGITDAGTYAILGVAGKGLMSTKALSIASDTPLLTRIARGAGVGAMSGLPAGFVNAELDSVTRGRGLASGAEIGGGMASYALFGGLLGGIDGATSRSRFHKLAEGDAKASPAVTTSGDVQTLKRAVSEPGPGMFSPAPKPAGNREVPPANVPERVETKSVTADPPAKPEAENILPVRKSGYIDGGDEGKVYSNGDGSVTKVYFDKARDLQAVKAIYDKLESIGVRTPKILEIGKTEDGSPAMRMEQIGDGDHLSWQLMMREIQGPDMLALRQQYYAFADAITKAGIRIDWQTKNMRFQDGKLYILDPSFMKNEPMGNALVDHYGRAIGPRP